MKFVSLFAAIAIFSCVTPSFADNNRACVPVSGVTSLSDATATSDYINLLDGTVSTTHAAEDVYTIPRAMTAYGLSVQMTTAPGSGDQRNFYLSVNGGVIGLPITCAVAGTATSCTSPSNTGVTIPADAEITILATSALGASNPTDEGETRWSFCLSENP